jgi:glycosyltransferase involved in cell wall biosynthesis
MEYMAMARPIVAFGLPEHRFTARDAACYARPNDVTDFARKIAALMDAADRCQDMGRRGRERIESKLAWPYQEQYLLDAYRKLDVFPKARAHDEPTARIERLDSGDGAASTEFRH